jgi:hypothetical protein
MRGTLHLMCADDVRWLVGLVGPLVAARYARRRLELGLDPALCERILIAIPEILADRGALVRAELMEAQVARDLPIDTSDKALAHLLLLAAVRGIVCRGPDRPDEEPTYVRLDDWVDRAPPIDRDLALAELARRFMSSYGPAGARPGLLERAAGRRRPAGARARRPPAATPAGGRGRATSPRPPGARLAARTAGRGGRRRALRRLPRPDGDLRLGRGPGRSVKAR